MILATTLTALFVVTAIATGLSLLDSWIRGRSAYGVLRREQALLDAGFIPQVDASEVRLRSTAARSFASNTGQRSVSRRSLASVSRSQKRRTPLPEYA